MWRNTRSSPYVQIGVVVGGIIQDCGSRETKYYPGIFTRLDHPEIVEFLEEPHKLGSNIKKKPKKETIVRFHKVPSYKNHQQQQQPIYQQQQQQQDPGQYNQTNNEEQGKLLFLQVFSLINFPYMKLVS